MKTEMDSSESSESSSSSSVPLISSVRSRGLDVSCGGVPGIEGAGWGSSMGCEDLFRLGSELLESAGLPKKPLISRFRDIAECYQAPRLACTY